MDDQDMTICWAYGDREDTPAMGVTPKVYVDRQETDEIYSSLSIARSGSGYVIEMEIYRLGYFRGTAVETRGMLVYTDDFADMKGTIQCDLDHAVFEVTESSSDLVEVGTTCAVCSAFSIYALSVISKLGFQLSTIFTPKDASRGLPSAPILFCASMPILAVPEP